MGKKIVRGDLDILEATPAVNFKDTSCTDDDINASIEVQATDTGSGTEDIDLAFKQMIAGILTTWLAVDADGDLNFQDRNLVTTGTLASTDVGIGTTTPAGKLHTVLSAGAPAIFGGSTIATLTGVSISNADPSVLTKDATIDDGLTTGDIVIVNSGTNATVGVFIVKSIVADTSVTLDRQAATGVCDDGNITYVNGEGLVVTSDGAIHLSDGTGASIIRQYAEPGLGSRLTIGLNEASRTMVICEVGDVDTDFGLAATNWPSLYIASPDGAGLVRLGMYNATNSFIQIPASNGSFNVWDDETTNLNVVSRTQSTHHITLDKGSLNPFPFTSAANIQLTDDNNEQSWLYAEPKINQTNTAAWNGLKIKADVSVSEGDGSTGYGNNLILAGTTIDEDMFKVDNTGRIILAESSTPAALADHAFLYAKDVAGTGNMFVADAAADETQISSHNFSLFTPDPAEQFPWSFYAENKALGMKINVDMAGMVRTVEALSGKKFIYYEDIPKSVDLEQAYKVQWKNKWIKENTTELEVTNIEAFEMVDIDVPTLYDVEVIDEKTGKIQIVKQKKKIDEKIIGYELNETEVKPKVDIIWETHKEQKSQLKESVRFDETNGKFFKTVIPNDVQAEEATEGGFEFVIPTWIVDRLK